MTRKTANSAGERRFPCAAWVALLLALTVASGAEAIEESQEPSPQISIQALEIQPDSPTADQLCRLTLRLRNGGSAILSRLVFRVALNGREIPVYRNHMFLTRIQPGSTETLQLFNFWTTESGRPAPADGILRVEVTLVDATWVRMETDEEGTTWYPEGPVPGLPISISTELTLRDAANTK